MQVHRTIKPPLTIYYTDDIMGEVVDYIRISSNRVREVVLQEHHQNAQCTLLVAVVTNHGEFRTSAFDFHTVRPRTTMVVAQVLFLRDLTKIHPHHIPQKKFKVGKIVVRPCDRSTQLLFAKHRIIVALNGKIKLDHLSQN